MKRPTKWWAIRSGKGVYALADDGFPMLFHYKDDAHSEALMWEDGDDWRPVRVTLRDAVTASEQQGK